MLLLDVSVSTASASLVKAAAMSCNTFRSSSVCANSREPAAFVCKLAVQTKAGKPGNSLFAQG